MKPKPNIIDSNKQPPESSMMRTSSKNGEHCLSACSSGVHLPCERRKRRPLVHVSSPPLVKNAKRTRK
eukprot:scaffold4128_cov70-Cylindrotheca_fusiformis.AAC.1